MGRSEEVATASGGSRAAKRRRKQKNKTIGSPHYDCDPGTGITRYAGPAAHSQSEGRRRSSTNASIHRTLGKDDTSAAGDKRKRTDVKGSSVVSRAEGDLELIQASAGRDHADAGKTDVPVVIDAAHADDRTRALLELDAHAVLTDTDVESGLKARQLLQWLVAPLSVEEFYDSFW